MNDADANRNEQVGLAEAIDQVRKELIDAQSKGEKESLQFRMGEVKLEFAAELAREGGVEAGVKLWVVNVGAKGPVTSTKTHTVTVTMTPQTIGASGQWEDARVGDVVAGRPPSRPRDAVPPEPQEPELVSPDKPPSPR